MRRLYLVWAVLGSLWACDDAPISVADGALDAAVADAAFDLGQPDEGLVADLGPAPDQGPAFVRPRFEPAGAGFYDLPWPSDARLTAAGTPDLSAFPTDRASFLKVIDEVQGAVRGFGTMPVVYLAFDHPIGDLRLPDPARSLDPASPIQLLALGDACGARVPVEATVRLEADRYILAETLQVKNALGTVLAPAQTYALVVRTAFGADQGRPARAPAGFVEAWAGDGSQFSASLQPLRDCLPQTGLAADELAMATVFTTQDPAAELRLMRDLVMDPEQVRTRAPETAARDGAWSRRRLNLTTLSGRVPMPVFQTGQTPYAESGGGLVFEGGAPVIQRWEPVPWAVAWRSFPDAPFEGARPALVFIDGTGWSPWGHLHSNWTNEALDAGFVVFSFMPQFHGGRAGVEGDPELLTFNLLNPPAGRANFRQQAVETAFFARVVREQLARLEGVPATDVSRLVYGGQSQGALVGAITAAVDDSYAAYVLNGLSTYLSLTILGRKDIIDFERVVRGLVGNEGPLDLFSPALQIMQLGSEVVDPHNFARLWRGSDAMPTGAHVFVINGQHDDTTTPDGILHLTRTGGLPVLDPPGWDLDPWETGAPETVTLPLTGNTVSHAGGPVTLATYLDANDNHFTIYHNATLRQMALRFWQTALSDGVPTLATTMELLCEDGVDDDGDALVDCADPDCAARAPCVEVRCTDGLDDDHNGLTDCEDPRCVDTAQCQEPDCDDGLDEDGDGLVDCADPGCATREPCVETRCRDRQDGDSDGLVDCADPDCANSRDCHELRCADGEDDDRDGLVDCEDDECFGHLACPEPACDDGTDEDGDGRIDCADPRCAGTEACPVPAETACDDGADNDADGLPDCADPDCALGCAAETCADGDLGSAVGVAVFQGTLEGAGDDWPPGDCTRLGSGQDAPDIALRWTAPADGRYLLSTLGSEADTVLMLFADACDPERALACHDDQRGVSSSAITLQIEAGQSVVLVISGYGAADTLPVRLHVLPIVAE
jgi:hypothetical protein